MMIAERCSIMQNGGNLMNDNHRPKYTLQALEKSLEVIDCLAAHSSNRGLGVSEISKMLCLGKSTIHRILDTLAAHNYVEKFSEQNRYRLGWRLFEIGNLVTTQHDFHNFDFDIMQKLCHEYGETVNLGIPVGSGVAVIAKAEPETNLIANLKLGRNVPIHATALGKVLLAGFDDIALQNFLGTISLTGRTATTITSKDELLLEIQQVRINGYAIDNEEYYQGLCCLAMPIKNHREETIAALSVSGPSIRMDAEKRQEISLALKKATTKLSTYMGSKLD